MTKIFKQNMDSIVLVKDSDKIHSIRYDAPANANGPVKSLYLLREALEGSGRVSRKIRVTVEFINE